MKLATRAFDLVEQLRSAASVDQVEQTFSRILGESGVSAFIICDVPPGCVPGAREIHSSGWDPEWERKYLDRRYAEVDPVPNSVNSFNEPYFWRDVTPRAQRGSRAMGVMEEARSEFRMHDGLCIPIHGLDGIAGLVSIATEEAEWTLSGQEQAAIHLVGLYAYEAVRRIKRPSMGNSASIRLSPREADCIRWVAEGKTAWEIGMILSVSQETVRTYLKSAARKLDTRSQAHLVARAHRLGLIC